MYAIRSYYDYITGNDRTSAESSPYLEVFKEKGIEVLIMTDDFDDISYNFV